ncbi:hypothetical protein [Nonomuraea endophytica]|uniref:hypothetical protein n=1 Tax=Nonomuraea endophytica TaxID=714136 RepID=UPI0037C97857
MTPITTLMPPELADDPYVGFSDVAQMAGIPEGTLRHLRHNRRGPDFKRVGRHLKIRRSLATQWVRDYLDGNV